MIRAVVDVNVLVSALINPSGTPAQVLDLWREEAFLLVTSDAILGEFQRVALSPKLGPAWGLTRPRVAALVAGLRKLAIVTPGGSPAPRIARDPEDDKVVACAVEGGADYIVTGDADLLAIGSHQGIEITTPAAFVAALAEV